MSQSEIDLVKMFSLECSDHFSDSERQLTKATLLDIELDNSELNFPCTIESSRHQSLLDEKTNTHKTEMAISLKMRRYSNFKTKFIIKEVGEKNDKEKFMIRKTLPREVLGYETPHFCSKCHCRSTKESLIFEESHF